MTFTTDTIIIGAGQAGLAMSHELTGHGVDHVLLDRGRVAERWRSERWDSLRLLTPNWQSRLPGWSYQGSDPDGYMTMPEVIDYLSRYAESFSAPVHEQTSVQHLRLTTDGYRVQTDQGAYRARTAVIATGAADTPRIPSVSQFLPPEILQLTPTRYRNPGQLPGGGVLVVGASASGVQLASEIRATGREVLLAAGSHNRLPRAYRGMDIQFWLDATGVLDTRYDEVGDLAAARRAPSLQLAGSLDRSSVDLGVLRDRGVRLAGRLESCSHGRLCFSDDLAARVEAADRRQSRLLDRIDAYIATHGLTREVEPVDRPRPIDIGDALRDVALVDAGIETVIWATGFRPDYPWLDVPVTDRHGEIVHDGGITCAPGLYVLGLQFLRRRKSSFIDGVGDDARELAAHLVSHLDHIATPA